MGLFSVLSQGVTAMASSAVDAGEGYAAHDDFWYNAAYASTAGMRVNERTVKQLAVVFACVAKKATAIASLPIQMAIADDGGNVTLKPNHPIFDLLNHKPNDFQTAYHFRWQMQAWVELYGNACAEIKPGPRGAVDQLIPMHPNRVIIERLMGSGKFRYRYNDPLTNTTRILMQEEVFHLRDMCDETGIGQSRIRACAATHGLALAQQDSQSRFVENDSRPAVVATGTNFKTKEDEEKYIEAWQRTQTGKNRGKIAVMPPGVDIRTLSITPVEAQMLEALRYSDVKLCSLYNIFPHLVGVDAGKAATFNSTEQFNLMHVQQCVRPMGTNWDQQIKADLIVAAAYYSRHDYAELLVGDTLSQAAFILDMVQSGVLNADEARAILGRNPTADGSGKTYWNQGNWSPASQTERGSANGGGAQGKSRAMLDKQNAANKPTPGNGENAEPDDESS